MRCGLIIALVAPLLLSWPVTSAGQGEQDIRWIDQNGASSDCIGSPAGAKCAVETALACRVRLDAALCETIGLSLPPDNGLPFSARNPDPFDIVELSGIKYLIHDEEQGDSRRIGVSVLFYGKYGLNWPDNGWRRLIYSVRRSDIGWRVDRVSWQPWIRRIGPRKASSQCIGRLDTPVCTVETHIACRVRGEDALCADAGGLEPKHFRPRGATVLYYIDRIRKWLPPELAALDSLLVTVWVAESTDLPAPGAEQPGGAYVARAAFVPVSYTLERRDGAWNVINRTERP